MKEKPATFNLQPDSTTLVGKWRVVQTDRQGATGVVRFDQKINSGQMVKMMLPSEIPDRPSRILAVTARLMAHYGYDKTIVDDIAREAGMSKGAIYLH